VPMPTGRGAPSMTPRPIIAASTASSSAMRPYAGWAGRAGPIFSKAMLSPSRQDGVRHQADATDPAGRRVSAAPESAAALDRTHHGDARKCAIEPSADLLQPCSLPSPLASASRRRMPVHAAAGSRNSSRRCASPRETRTPGPWHRNRLAHSWAINRRLPQSNAPSKRRKRHSRRPLRAPSVSINKGIELGVRGRWPPLSECTICSDPASRSSSCREVGCAALQTIRREYAAPPHGSRPSRPSRNVGFLPIPGSSHVLVAEVP